MAEQYGAPRPTIIRFSSRATSALRHELATVCLRVRYQGPNCLAGAMQARQLMTQSGHYPAGAARSSLSLWLKSGFVGPSPLFRFWPVNMSRPMVSSKDPAYSVRVGETACQRSRPSVSTARVGVPPPMPSAISCSEVTSPSSGLSFAIMSMPETNSASRMWTTPAYPSVFLMTERAWSGRPSVRSLKNLVGSATLLVPNTTSPYTELVQQV